MNYDLDEPTYLKELADYIDSTYKKHYKTAGSQTIVEIINKGDGIGYSKGNIRKYLDRYGHKGSPEDHREDILKLIHNGLFLLIAHDRKINETK